MKPLTAREVEAYLRANGYVVDHATGSHRIWRNDAKGHAVPVPRHGNATMRQGTLKAIFRECGIEPPKR